jgi:hypothetical protein
VKAGDQVELVCGERRLRGQVEIASANQRSLAVVFDGVLAGHVGMMPLLLDDAGVYRSIVTGDAVEVRSLP